MVLWLDPKDAPKKPEDVDRFTCSEIPDPKTSPRLHKLVTQNMSVFGKLLTTQIVTLKLWLSIQHRLLL